MYFEADLNKHFLHRFSFKRGKFVQQKRRIHRQIRLLNNYKYNYNYKYEEKTILPQQGKYTPLNTHTMR